MSASPKVWIYVRTYVFHRHLTPLPSEHRSLHFTFKVRPPFDLQTKAKRARSKDYCKKRPDLGVHFHTFQPSVTEITPSSSFSWSPQLEVRNARHVWTAGPSQRNDICCPFWATERVSLHHLNIECTFRMAGIQWLCGFWNTRAMLQKISITHHTAFGGSFRHQAASTTEAEFGESQVIHAEEGEVWGSWQKIENLNEPTEVQNK